MAGFFSQIYWIVGKLGKPFCLGLNQTPCIDNALQLSLYWEGDLRNLSYFLNKRKGFEFYN